MATITGTLTYTCADINEYNTVLAEAEAHPDKFSNISADSNTFTVSFDLNLI